MIVNLIHHEQEAFNSFMAHFDIKAESGQEIRCSCPSCGKEKLYISVKEARSAPGTHQVVMNCFHGCDYKEILQSAGIPPKDLYLTSSQPRRTRDMCAVKRQHIYTDQNGQTAYRKTIYKYDCYWEYNGKQKYPGDKDVYWETYTPGQGYTQGGSCNYLYHLDKLQGDTVYIPEGEKDVETLEKMGFTATSSGGGAKKTATDWKKHRYIEQLEGVKAAYILADNDMIGKQYAVSVAEYLTQGGIECKIISTPAIYPEVKEHGDISDIADTVGLDKAKELLLAAVNAAESYLLQPAPVKAPEERPENPYNADGKGRLSLMNLETALKIMDITVKYNVINHQIEYSGAGLKGIREDGINAVIPQIIYNKLQYYLKGCTSEKIAQFLNVIAFDEKNAYNPVLEVINSTEWDGNDHLNELYNLMNLEQDDDLSRYLLKKWLMQCYCGLYNTLSEPFALDLTLVLVGKQGYGKTRLFEKLAISSKYFKEGAALDPRDKDSRMQATAYWITELGEIGSTMKKEIDVLKAFISNTNDENRPPYGKTTIKHPRITSFCGTTNDMQFLIDETGNRRYATIKLPDDKYIDVKSKEFKEFDVLQLWAQIAYTVNELIRDGESYASAFRLTKDEQAELDERNKLHSKPLKGEQECIDIISSEATGGSSYIISYRDFTVSEFIAEHREILGKYTSVQIGKCLIKLGYEPIRKRINGVVCKVYNLPHKQRRYDRAV